MGKQTRLWGLFALVILLCGCSVEKVNTEKIKDIEFTVLGEDEIPEELKAVIDKKQENVMRETYVDGNWAYIAIGYGKKEKSGYSVEIDECYETANAIYIHTNLWGPAENERVIHTTVYPQVVIKMEYIDKHIVFE